MVYHILTNPQLEVGKENENKPKLNVKKHQHVFILFHQRLCNPRNRQNENKTEKDHDSLN